MEAVIEGIWGIWGIWGQGNLVESRDRLIIHPADLSEEI